MTRSSERPLEHHGVYYWPSRRGAEQAIDDMMIRRQYPHARVVEYTRGYAVQLYTSGPYIPLSGDERHTFAGDGDVLDNPGARMPQAFTWEDAKEILGNRQSRKLGANTVIEQDRGSGDIAIRLYGTRIIVYGMDDTIRINTGGYHTRTTLSRINAFLSPKARIYSKRGKLYIESGSGVSPFEDGATLTAARGGVQENPRRRTRQNPGKFDSDLDRYMYKLSMDGTDEDISFADNWYGRMNGVTFLDVIRAAEDEGEDEHSARKAWRAELGTGWRGDTINTVILHEDSYGFFFVHYYRSDRDADKHWKEIIRESEEYYGDEDSPP